LDSLVYTPFVFLQLFEWSSGDFVMNIKNLYLSTIALCLLIAVKSSEDEDFSSLSRVLSSYDTLHHDSFRHHRSRRSRSSGHTDEHMEFDTLDRSFKLVLKPDTSLLAPNFRVVAVDARNKQRVVDVQLNMYHGYVEGERDTSSVNAYWDEDKTLTASIRNTEDVFVIEPSWRHLPNSSNYSMISYRGSSINMTKDLGQIDSRGVVAEWSRRLACESATQVRIPAAM